MDNTDRIMKVLKLGQSLCSSRVASGSAFENLYSLDFDGVDDYLNIPDADVLSINNSGADRGFSMSFWLKLPTAGGNDIINKSTFWNSGGYRYEYKVHTNYLSRIFFVIYGNDNVSIYQQIILDQNLSTDTWYHIGFTFDLGSTSSSLKGYINGVYNSGAAYSYGGTWAAPANTVAPLEFAKREANYGEAKLDEVALFDDELSLAQIQNIYNSGTPTDLSSESYLLGYWRNGDPTGTGAYPTIVDQSSNSNDGTMNNMSSSDIVTDVP